MPPLLIDGRDVFEQSHRTPALGKLVQVAVADFQQRLPGFGIFPP